MGDRRWRFVVTAVIGAVLVHAGADAADVARFIQAQRDLPGIRLPDFDGEEPPREVVWRFDSTMTGASATGYGIAPAVDINVLPQAGTNRSPMH